MELPIQIHSILKQMKILDEDAKGWISEAESRETVAKKGKEG